MNSFLTTALLATAALAAPTTSTDDCAAKAQAMKSWTLRNFNFNSSHVFTTPAHQFGNANAGFNLVNTVTQEERRCDAYSSRLAGWFYGDQVYQCKTLDGTQTPDTTFTFSMPEWTVKVNQSYECPGAITQYVAEGGADLSHQIRYYKTDFRNGGWTISPGGQIYQSTNEKIDPFDGEIAVDSIRVNA